MRKKPELLAPGNLVISPSQVESHETCQRQRWFTHKLKLRQVKKSFLGVGTILHAIIERYLSADQLGRVPNPVPDCLAGQKSGEAVNLYPEGWTKHVEKGQTVVVLDPREEALCKRLIQEAIENGTIQRTQQVKIEDFIQLRVIDGVELQGYIDLHTEEGIHDHKSFGKSGKRYLKRDGPKDLQGNPIPIVAPYTQGDGSSPNCVGHDGKMQIYAYAHWIDQPDGSQPVLVRHNQFPKDPDDLTGPRFVEAWLAPSLLQNRWLEVDLAARQMLDLEQYAHDDDWKKIPDPLASAKHDVGACSAYGGCTFRDICARRETVSIYRHRLERILGPEISPETAPSGALDQGQKPVGLFDKFNKTAAMSASTPTPAAAPVAAAPAAPARTVEDPYLGVPIAPWGRPECKACRGTGQTISKGRPCKVCDTMNRSQGKPTSEAYNIVAQPNGWLTWTPKSGVAPAESTPAGVAVPVAPAPAAGGGLFARRGKAAVATPTISEEEDDEAEAIAMATHPEELLAMPQAQPTPAKATRGAGAGRPKLGVVLRLGCTVLKGPTREVLTIQDLLARIGAELASSMGAANYFELDAFKRRDAISANIREIADALGSITVVGHACCPDTKALYSALMMVSNDVTEGVNPVV